MPSLVREPQRTIEEVIFDGDIGLVSATDLLGMREDDWGLLRDRLTDGRQGKANGLTARCVMCNSGVYIQSRPLRGQSLPYFAHFQGGPPTCPWYHAKNMSPDQAKAAQYGGQQESPAHRQLCHLIDALLKLDTRYQSGSVGKYVAPTASQYGRFPDVYAQLHGFRPLAFELQLSQTFQTEISARCIHYEREKAGLIWVLHGVAPNRQDIPQSFHDVIRRHRGNAFVLDHEATKASYERKTLVLSCYRKKSDRNFDAPILVTLDELTFPDNALPYREDRLTQNLIDEIKARRAPWHAALKKLDPPWHWDAVRTEPIARMIQASRTNLPGVFGYEEEGNYKSLRLIATLFSALSAANSKWKNYVTKQDNLSALLNTVLDLNTKSGGLQEHAALIEQAIANTPLQLKDSVQTHIDRAKHDRRAALSNPESPIWQGMAYLFPEILHPRVREELVYLGALPAWAMSAPKPLTYPR